MAVYNGQKYIFEQLNSILKQLSPGDEVIISDNCSTDSILDVIKSIKDSRIAIYSFCNKSPVLNFENALSKSSGEYIFLSDQDDIWEENKVQVILELLNKYDTVISDCTVIDEKNNILFDSFFKIMHSKKGLFKNYYKPSFLGCCMAFRRSILIKSLPFPPNIPMHDWWIALISEMFGKTYYLQEKLVRYRRHTSNATATTGQSQYGIKYKILFRLILFYYLFIRYMSVKVFNKNYKNVILNK